MDFVNILKDSRSVQPFEVRKVPRQEIKYFKGMGYKSMKLNLTSMSFFPRDVLDEILNLFESVSEGFPSYSSNEGEKINKSRKENPQKLTQLSSRSHPRHLVGKRTAQKDTIIDITSDSQVNSNFPYR